jgi:hypothetical protein
VVVVLLSDAKIGLLARVRDAPAWKMMAARAVPGLDWGELHPTGICIEGGV